jgi:hypothetical protein
MKLYEISGNLSTLWDEIDAAIADAEDQTALDAALKHYEGELAKMEGTHAQKCLDIACLIKGLEAEAEAVKAEETRLKERRQSAEKRAEWLRAYLSSHMEPGTNLKDARSVIGWRKSEAVELLAIPEQLPPAFVCTKTIVDADKTAIKDALKAGPVPALEGKAQLVTRYNLQLK